MVALLSKAAFVMATILLGAESVKPNSSPQQIESKPAAAASRSAASPKLRGVNASEINHALIGSAAGAMPCQCVATNPTWKPCTRTVPRCVFIDLGAADGNSFADFLNNGYGDVGKCPSVQWSAVLVEANPRFNGQLAAVGTKHPGSLTVMSSTAAYMCEATTSFFLDTVNTGKNFWGSSMSESHPDVQRSGKQKVTVPTMNLNRILYEQTIPSDWVMVKMDIEGSEYDVLPCTAKSPSASLIDRLYLEQHQPSWGMAGTTLDQMETAKNELRSKGVDIPDYFSQTL
jgi:FkbM family methyltransferase